MQVKAVAKKIVDLFGNNNVNATVGIGGPTIVCYAEDYDHAIDTIRAITNAVYMTVNKNIVACTVDGVTVAITAGKLHYSDQVISDYACAAMSRSELHPEYMGERQLIVAVQKMIAERFKNNNIVGSSECVDDVIVCHVDKLHGAYLAIEDIAVDFVTVEPDRMIAGIVKGIVVGIEYVELPAWPTDNYLIRSYANQAIAKHGGYPKYDKAIYVPSNLIDRHIPDNSPLVEELAKNLMKEPVVKNFIDKLASLTPEERAEILAKKESVKQVEEYLNLKLTAVKVGFGIDERNGYLSCKVDALTDLVRADVINSLEQLCDTIYPSIKYVMYRTVKYAPHNNVVIVFAEKHPNDDGRHLDEDMYDAICQAGIEAIIERTSLRIDGVNHMEKPDNGDVMEKPMPKGQYNLFCNARLTAVEPSLNIFNHVVNVNTGDRLFKAIFRLIESYMRYFNMVSIPSLYGQGWVTDPANIPKLYSTTPSGTLQWDRHAIIMLPTCHEVEWHSSQYISEVAKKHNETFLLNIIDNDGRHFKVAIHGTVASYHGKPLYLMNIFELLQDNQEPYSGDVYEHLMDYLNK